MRALVTTPDTKFGLKLTQAPDPVASPDQVIIDVRFASLNHGDVGYAATTPEGKVMGWDAAGVVTQSAADGTGPAVGTKVLTFGSDGAWAERRAVSVNELAVVPDGVDLAVASTLPVAGVTALRALRASGPLQGKRVLVTGASGGVGRYAIQLATIEGAHVVALARRGEGLAELGAQEVVSDLDDVEPVDVVLENVGGPTLVRSWELLKTGGVLQSIGWTSLEPAVFPPYATVAPAKSLVSFQSGNGYSADLAHLLKLVAEGKLTVDIGWRGSWNQFDEAAAALFGRQVTGKAVVEID
ncbi:NADPH:quinone reductase-like Zn-dependent oxidoreductase [Kibdelosporangium banguiense]|uniref:NADPH:quinone reductase-like Zn-dependent oxidoreductase n=1 Tax=Kibdelosporangium banguiense TaxID=1365924 RepID=A0ABS4U0M7_9PSEU|nr:zinc-binding dehydrogenase [Kibdelosporangium banguiense]MBP2329798.1 NADPH:quinone reductase-like Zn-dependent oxidoreductase [Kibdelosporangium banguiense]